MIENVLTVVPVRDIDVAREWYSRLLGREPDNNPMPSLIQWQVLPGAWMQVFLDADRAGHTQTNLAVDDIDTHSTQLTDRGLAVGDITDATNGVRLAPITDPDGNVITLIGGFRTVY
ncbi:MULTISPECIES: VOC family protein [unclassified Rhodococcus (in: high G+C Gram-positive bacteria)]|uniref:VOC family protein n=1 Tax=unclassified Rhodococcus (in: high G+C Gram-positive bacteria) TaxID=192944 RepID=UPI0006F6C665|nr:MULTISPECIES: glyoxalase/bleomycin resistance/dioxygenase family protein [unclassified Rhodococcus (in: high G+C Gram-positive bacteria)]KQU39101.1 glyoxalase [Rhodococcus sp. Leaf225]KQU43537.1 glyoxalase [Rhodococcus sp. Leaf258]